MSEPTAEVPEGSDKPDIEVKIAARPLPPEAVELRKLAAEREAILEPIVQPRIEGVISTTRDLTRQLQSWHSAIADNTDLDLTAYSRASAIWLLSGRCLGLLEVQIVQA